MTPPIHLGLAQHPKKGGRERGLSHRTLWLFRAKTLKQTLDLTCELETVE